MLLQAVEAEIDEDGQVTLQQPLVVRGRQRAVLTVLGPKDEATQEATSSNVAQSLAVLAGFALLDLPASSPDEIEKTIEENRNAWGE